MNDRPSQPVDSTLQRQNSLRLFALGLVVLAALLLLIAAREAWVINRQAFPGFLYEPTGVIAAVGIESWPGYVAGLRWPERVVAVQGRALSPSTNLARALVDYAPGDVVDLTIQHPEHGAERIVRLELTSLPADALTSYFTLPYLLGWMYLAIGFWVVWTQRRGEAGVAFAILCVIAVTVFGLMFDLYTSQRLWWAWATAIPLGGSAFLHLALVFPQRLRLLTRTGWPLWPVYLPGLILAVMGVVATADWEHPIAYFGPWIWGRAWLGLGILGFVALMVYRYLFSASPVARAQVRTVILGAFLGFAPFVAWNLFSFEGGLDFPPVLILPWMLLFPLSIAYAIPHHRTLDIAWILRQSLIYTLLAVALIAGFVGLPWISSQLLQVNIHPLSPTFVIFYTFLIAMAVGPAYRGLDTLLRRILGQVSREEALARFMQQMATVSTWDEVIDALQQVLHVTMAPQHAVLYLFDEHIGRYIPHVVLGEPDAPMFGRDSPLALRMAESPTSLYLPLDGTLPMGLESDQAKVIQLDAVLFVPVPEHGWLAIGRPPAGRRFRTDDLQFLEGLVVQTGAAVERVRLIADLEWRSLELETILRVAQSVGYSVEVDDLLELIFTQISKVLDVSNYYVALHNPDRRTLRFAFYVEDNERLYPDDEWPDDQGLTGVIVHSGRPIVTDDYLAECKRHGVQSGGKPGRAWMGAPLIARDRVMGVINVSSFDPQVSYTLEQERIFRAVADQAAMILDKAWVYQEIEDRAAQLEALNDVSGVITSVLDMEQVLQLIMEKAVEITRAEAGSLLLVDEDTGDLIFEVILGPSQEELKGVRLPMGTGVVGHVATSAVPLIVDDVTRDERWFSGVDQKSDFVTRSLICVPLIARRQVIGVIELINRRDRRPFDKSDQDLLTAFAAQAAVSIENARLFTTTDQALADRVEELSIMQRIDRELNATLDYRRVMDLTLEWAVRMTGADVGLLALIVEPEEGRRGFHFVSNHGYPPEMFAADGQEIWPLNQGLIGRAVAAGEPSLVSDVTSDADYVPMVHGMVSQLTVPIRREDQIVGVIVLESSEHGELDEDTLQIVVRLADHAAIAIENARLFDAVQAANNAKTEFVSFVSHELKQPMTSIKGYSDLLYKGTAGELNDLQRQFMEVIRGNVARMDRLVQDLLDISRIEAGRIRLDIQHVELREVLEEAVRAVHEQIAAKSQQLQVDVPDVLPTVLCDRTRLVQVLVNLLSNAYKYTPEGGAIAVHVHQTNGFLRCAVRDTGVGITPEDQERLFTKYFRASDPLVRNEPGTGLGLVITKSLVELQGGQIGMESAPGQGSEFYFTVPVAS